MQLCLYSFVSDSGRILSILYSIYYTIISSLSTEENLEGKLLDSMMTVSRICGLDLTKDQVLQLSSQEKFIFNESSGFSDL